MPNRMLVRSNGCVLLARTLPKRCVTPAVATNATALTDTTNAQVILLSLNGRPAVTDDIGERLRLVAKVASNPEVDPEDQMIGVRPAFLLEAAKEIERLRARVAELEEEVERVEDNAFYSYLAVAEGSDD
jgi:hypothetical protein